MSELSDDARALLAQARQGVDDEPDAEDRARVRAKVAAALALSTLGGTAASAALPKTAAAQLASASLSTKLVVASLVVATAGAATIGLRGSPEPVQRDATRPSPAYVEPSSPTPLPTPPPTPAVVTRPADGFAAPVDDAEHDAITPDRRAAKAGVARRTDAPAEAEPELPPSLQAELSLITAAQEALRAGRPGLALERASEHAARFPKGALIQERLGIDAIAACALGQRTRGRSALEKLARRAPSAPLLVRARAACRESDPE